MPPDPRVVESGTALDRRGAVTLVGFGILWGLVGASGLDGVLATSGRIASLAAGAVLVAACVHWTDRHEDRPRSLPDGWRTGVARVNVAQLLVIAMVVAGGLATGAPWIVPPVVCLVVGLHFLPLATCFAEPAYRRTGAALVLIAVAGAAGLAAGAATSRIIVGAGATAVLWSTATVVSLTP